MNADRRSPRRRALAALVAATAIGVGAAGVAVGMRPDRVEPSPAVVEAQELLAAPTVVAPLPGSMQLSASRYLVPGPCADARAAYLAPSAPLPPQATVSEHASAIVVTQPWATSGVLFVDVPEGCRYEILASGTLVIDGTFPGVPAGDHYVRTICAEPDDEEDTFGMFAELLIDGQPTLLVIFGGQLGLVPGSLADLSVLEADPPPIPGDVVFDGSMDGGFAGTLTAPDGATSTITGSCTGSVFELIPT